VHGCGPVDPAGLAHGGHGTPAILLGLEVTEALRPAIAIDDDPDALARAAHELARAREVQRLPLLRGIADLRTLRFEPHDGAPVRLSQREADLLAYLARHSHREVPRDEVQTEVFGHAKAVQTRAVDMAVSRLRKKIERDPKDPEVLLTARGGGYRLALPQPDPEGLVGRRDTLATLRRHLLAGSLVTLKGPPGVGKTRLAEVLASDPRALLVRLDTIRTDEQVVVAVATQLELATGREPADRAPAQRLAAVLEELAPSLLALDNAEHVRDGVRDLVTSLRADEHLDLPILVTTQVALDLPDEDVIELAPLDRDAARALFLARADEAPTGDALDTIVDALDGLPLAIELASQWGAVVPWERVPELLSQAEPSLTARLQAAWDLLPDDGRDVLEALAAFADRVPFEDLLAVAPRAPVGLKHLLAASLVQRVDDRYRLLAPVRRFVRDHGPHRHAAETAHHAHLAAMAETAFAQLPTRAGPDARRRLAQRLADLDRAYAFRRDGWLALAIEAVLRIHGDPDARRAIIEDAFAHETRPNPRLALATMRLDVHPSQRLGELADDLAACPTEGADPVLAARARVAVAWVRYRTAPAPGYADEALAYARDVGAHDAARMAEYLVSGLAVRGDTEALRQALPQWERIVDDLEALEAYPYALRTAVSVASTWASLGNVGRSRVAVDTFARLLEAWPDTHHEGALHNLRAYQRQDEGDTEGALAAFEAMRRIRCGRRGTPDAVWLKNRAMVLLDAGRVSEAERDLELSVQRLESLPHIHSSACDLLALAHLDQGRPERAIASLDDADVAGLTGMSLAYHQETRALAYALAGRTEEADALWSTLDADSLGEQPAAVFHAYRAAAGHRDARARALAFQDPEAVVSRTLAELLDTFDDPVGVDAFLARTPPAPLLTRLVARLRRHQLPSGPP